MGGEERWTDPARQYEEGFSVLAAHYSPWEDDENIHVKVHFQLLIQLFWSEASVKILFESSLEDGRVQPDWR